MKLVHKEKKIASPEIRIKLRQKGLILRSDYTVSHFFLDKGNTYEISTIIEWLCPKGQCVTML